MEDGSASQTFIQKERETEHGWEHGVVQRGGAGRTTCRPGPFWYSFRGTKVDPSFPDEPTASPSQPASQSARPNPDEGRRAWPPQRSQRSRIGEMKSIKHTRRKRGLGLKKLHTESHINKKDKTLHTFPEQRERRKERGRREKGRANVSHEWLL